MKLDEALLKRRASTTFSAVPRPFVRWAGSKRPLLASIVGLLPKNFGIYHEPFLGSGSLFFLIQPERANLGDACAELIRTYEAVAQYPQEILDYLSKWRPDKEFYYSIRDNPQEDGPEFHAARFIYLNKTCWNGLYRVNGAGKFNVPYGLPKTDSLVDEANFLACSRILARHGTSLSSGDFATTLRTTRRGDFAFLDPPYVTQHNNNGFVEYNERIFSWADQLRLASVAKKLANRGVNVMVTNANHRDILDLYAGFTVEAIERSSTIASDNSKRGRTTEAVFFKYPER